MSRIGIRFVVCNAVWGLVTIAGFDARAQDQDSLPPEPPYPVAPPTATVPAQTTPPGSAVHPPEGGAPRPPVPGTPSAPSPAGPDASAASAASAPPPPPPPRHDTLAPPPPPAYETPASAPLATGNAPAGAPSVVGPYEPPVAPQRRTRHTHDGFYARVNLGFGAMSTRSRFESGDVRFRAGGLALDVLLGGTPTPGLAIGGGLMLVGGAEPEFEVSGADADGSLTAFAEAQDSSGLVLLGPMIDGFPDPQGGFHVGGLLGFAAIGLVDENDNGSGGFGLSLWAGYDWWVGDDWAIGGLLRLAGARTALALPVLGETTDTTGSIALAFSALYH